MATVTGLTAARMLDIEAGSVVDGEVVAGNLILSKFDGSQINAGSVVGPQGPQGPQGDPGTNGVGVPVGGSAGQLLSKVSGTNYDTAWVSPAVVGIGTSLPGSPANGDEYILVDSLTAPTYAWRFRYVSGISDAYKWVFIGGADMLAINDAQQNVSGASGTWLDAPTAGPGMTIPRAGIYRVRGGAKIGYSGGVWGGGYFGFFNGSAVTEMASAQHAANEGYMTNNHSERQITIGAGAAVKLMYMFTGSPGPMTVAFRRLSIEPVRVS